MTEKKISLIVAGGYGYRMNQPVTKQLMQLNGLPVLMHTFSGFLKYDPLIEFILVLPENQIEYWKRLCRKFDFNIQHQVVNGGQTRFHSVKNGLSQINKEGIVFIHDGVRPLVSTETIKNCYNTAIRKGNAIPVILPSESIREVFGEDNRAVDRNRFYLVQTPQTFKVSLIKEAYTQEYSEYFTDDASVLESTGLKIHLVKGNRHNIKITYPEDITIAEAFLKIENKTML